MRFNRIPLLLAAICMLLALVGCGKNCANNCDEKADPDCMAEMCDACCAYWMGLNGCYAEHYERS